jgi:H+/Na+-translocating ferredoxin:NAD+ oxidoreductase subunit G
MSAQNLPAAPAISPVKMIVTLGGVALISGALIVTAYELTLPQIRENKRIATERAIDKILPGSALRKTFIVTPKGLEPTNDPDPQGTVLHAVYDANGKLMGLAAEGSASGYQDELRVLYAYSPECRCINGYHVLRNNDTPGIGNKVSSDPAFLANFKTLDARLNDAGTALQNKIVTVKHGTKTEAWQIDAISGATISSKAIGRAVNNSAQVVVPAIRANLNTLKQAQAKSP